MTNLSLPAKKSEEDIDRAVNMVGSLRLPAAYRHLLLCYILRCGRDNATWSHPMSIAESLNATTQTVIRNSAFLEDLGLLIPLERHAEDSIIYSVSYETLAGMAHKGGA